MEGNGSTAKEAHRKARAFMVWMGFAAMLGDITYEGARSLLGPYLGALGASAFAIALIAGAGELLSHTLRSVSGPLIDRSPSPWAFVVAGYALNALAVPALALVTNWEGAATLFWLERVAKAMRSPARSALLAEAASVLGPGRVFGFDEALDQIGAVLGPLFVGSLHRLWPDSSLFSYRVAFAALIVPALLNLGIVFRAQAIWPGSALSPTARPAFSPSSAFWRLLLGSALIAFGYADWALVSYHAVSRLRVEPSTGAWVYALAMAADALAALLLGPRFDRMGASLLGLVACLGAISFPLIFGFGTFLSLLGGALCWGLALGGQEALFKAALVRLVRPEERARAFGLFGALQGISWWLGSTFLGWLYERSPLMLVAGGVFTQLLAVPVLLGLGQALDPKART
ncbi:MAG: MFS transporter [Sandaracinaceae bacterium]|nr:MFS transporter [Sandaracinaceae bacterium]